MNLANEEHEDDMDLLRDALQHPSLRRFLWENIIGGERFVFGKFYSDDSNKVSRWLGQRDNAVDTLANILNTDLDKGLLMIRENWIVEGE